MPRSWQFSGKKNLLMLSWCPPRPSPSISVADLRGAQGMRAPPAQNSFIFMQFSEKIGQIIGWRGPPPPLGLAPPPLGNPGSATAYPSLETGWRPFSHGKSWILFCHLCAKQIACESLVLWCTNFQHFQTGWLHKKETWFGVAFKCNFF